MTESYCRWTDESVQPSIPTKEDNFHDGTVAKMKGPHAVNIGLGAMIEVVQAATVGKVKTVTVAYDRDYFCII